MLPELFNDMMFDNFFDDAFRTNRRHELLCDVKEDQDSYELNLSMPGVNKDDVKVSLKDGYLTVGYEAHKNNDEKDQKGRLIRQERYHGSASRSFYVGDGLKQEDIKAKFDNGELHITVPKETKAVENKENYIAIE